ncbi:MAG: aminotransferase class I/II-fold pyridoxal phosphate-dependent enzyme, partial [bacterium]|nr:aminotransferase class I/II-fold pyridoxal phosphate-dependent enzyme [bacterium]
MKIKSFKIERYFDKYEFNAPYPLSSSDCESFSVQELFQLEESAQEDFKRFWLGYTQSLGDPLLRDAIAGLYNQSKAEHVIVCAGAEEGIFIFMNTLLNPGDNIIVPSPCYQSLYEIAAAIGCTLTQWPLHPAQQWEPDIDFLQDHITPNTKAIVVNFPNNPTGATLSPDQFQQII